ncbi:hypothetical protein [Pseudonocardia asaccharolytica]|uniref:Uncharacterized protein n=1 Tax=Pseudonocardia asaccharolytica DSM 44247 = NBRC 16224 TaxID=1123024 RepID=A0A511D573_9PSEU|nr:hypothetical protein [Pseudonocardia asaccharolytica]GEL19915.1 hypothetical protein PA7_37520 [Pseudonocardia asaccharolytica DSM 44247 = NBRC 16224]
MRRRVWIPVVIVVGVAVVAVAGWIGWQYLRGSGFTDEFPVDRGALAPTGRNPYFVLEPGYQLAFEGGGAQLVITVLDETEPVDGVTTRVVEERETAGGALVELSRNFFAIDPRTRDVYYFGEDVDDYSGGRVVGHQGSWRSGVGGARFGLMMPGRPRVGMRHYQEIAPDVALDRAEILSTADTVTVPAGALTGVVRVQETTPLEPLTSGSKHYAPGIGLVRDGGLALVRYGPAG